MSPQSVAFSPDGRFLAVAGSTPDAVAMFSVSAGGVVAPVGLASSTGGSSPASVAFSPDGKLLAVANRGSNSVSMFFVATDGRLTLVSSPVPTGSLPTTLAFSPNGEVLVTSNPGDSSLSTFNVASTGVLSPAGAPFSQFDGPALAFAFCSDEMLVTSNATGSTSSVAVGPAGELSGLSSQSAGLPAYAATCGTSGRWFAKASTFDDTVSLFTVADTGYLGPVGPPVSTGHIPEFVQFSPDETLLATADYGAHSVSMFTVSSNGVLTQAGPPTVAGPGPIALAFSPSGKLLVTVNTGNWTIQPFWVSKRGRLTRIGVPTTTEARPEGIAFSPAGEFLAVANRGDDSVSMYSVWPSGASTAVGSPAQAGSGPVAVAFRADGERLAVANAGDDSVSMFAVSDGGGLTSVGAPAATGDDPEAVAFSPDGSLLATANREDDSVSMFQVSLTGVLTPIGSSITVGDFPSWVAFSPDGALLATANSLDDTVSVFSVSAGGELTSVGTPTQTGSFPTSLEFSPDGTLLATANMGGDSVSAFSVSTSGALTPSGSEATGADPIAVTFNHDGTLLATANRGAGSLSLLRVMPAGGLRPVGSETPAGLAPASVDFSPDGSLLALANENEDTLSVFPLEAPALDAWIPLHPSPATMSTSGVFGFESNYPSTFECSLDGGAFEPCEQDTTFPGLDEGGHILEVRARDLVGNAVATTATWSWLIDRTQPSAPELLAPVGGATGLKTAVDVSWRAATDAGSGMDLYELVVDGEVYRPVADGDCGPVCPPVSVKPLVDGQHTWRVDARDGAGNWASSETRTFTVDAASPSEFTLAGPQDGFATTDSRPTLSWNAAVDAGTGVANYDVLVDEHVVASVDASTTSVTLATALSEGVHRWRVVAYDAHGNKRTSLAHTLVVDVTHPTARLTAAPNPALAGRSVVFDAGQSSDAGSGIARYEWDLDGDGVFERDGEATASLTQSYAEPGTFGVQLRVTDRAGLSATARIDQRITTGSRSRGQLGVSIDDGARFTNDPKVTITAAWPSFASEMLVSNDGGFKAARPYGLRESTAWTLDSSGIERLPKTVYVRFLRGLTVSETYTDDIILDERPPSVLEAHLRPGRHAAQLRLRARDRGLAGLKAVQVTNDRRRPKAKFRAYRATVKLTKRKGERRLKLGKPVFVRVRDRAGNLSTWHVAQRTR